MAWDQVTLQDSAGTGRRETNVSGGGGGHALAGRRGNLTCSAPGCTGPLPSALRT